MSLLLFYLFNAGSKSRRGNHFRNGRPIEEDIPAPPGYHLMTRGEDRHGTINFRTREIVESRKEYRTSPQGSIVKYPFHPGRAPQGGARRAFRSFVEKGISLGRRQDLTGGGLLRSAGGWEGGKALREGEVYQKNDERILGDGDFVGQVLNSAQEEMEKRYSLRSAGRNLVRVASRVSAVLGVKPEEVWAKGLSRRIVEARSLLCYWAVRELGMPMSSLSRRLGISVPSVSESVTRGERIAEARNCCLLET